MDAATGTKRAVLIATGNRGKLRDFAAAAKHYGIEVVPVPHFSDLPPAVENAPTFEANAAKKAEHYSRFVNDECVLADDSGLCVHVLDDAPGVFSARYAAQLTGREGNSSDAENNCRLLREMADVPDEERNAAFVCAIAVARKGRLLACFRGEVSGMITHEPRGTQGFGYDPLFLIPETGKTFAELSAEEKAHFSHRGQAFRKFLDWFSKQNQ